MFPFSMLTMSKSKTLAWAVFCVGLAILCAYAGMSYVAYGPFAWAVILGSVAAYKFIRDRGIISQAEQVNVKPRRIAPPAITGKGSSRLFVPEPLDRH